MKPVAFLFLLVPTAFTGTKKGSPLLDTLMSNWISRVVLCSVALASGIVCAPAQAEDNPPIRSKKITLPKKAD